MYTNKQIWSVSYPILLSLLAQMSMSPIPRAGHVSGGPRTSAMGGLFIYVYSP